MAIVSTHPLAILLFIVTATGLLCTIGLLVREGAMPGIGHGGATPYYATLRRADAACSCRGLARPSSYRSRCPPSPCSCGATTRRSALLPYMLVLLVQIPSERALTRRFGPDMSPITGLIYTSYRVWQLWYLQGYIAATPGPITLAHDVARGLLLFGLGFWTVNLLFLAGVALPRTVALSHAHAT